MTVQLLDPIAKPHKFLFTTDQYHLMHEASVFQDGDRLELVNGEIQTMSSIGRKHGSCINRLVTKLTQKLGTRIVLSVQNSILLEDNSQPQPDLAILKPLKAIHNYLYTLLLLGFETAASTPLSHQSTLAERSRSLSKPYKNL